MIANVTESNVAVMENKLAYSVAEAANKVSMSKSYLRNEIRAKKLEAKLIGNRVLILNSDLQIWLEGKGDWEGIKERNN